MHQKLYFITLFIILLKKRCIKNMLLKKKKKQRTYAYDNFLSFMVFQFNQIHFLKFSNAKYNNFSTVQRVSKTILLSWKNCYAKSSLISVKKSFDGPSLTFSGHFHRIIITIGVIHSPNLNTANQIGYCIIRRGVKNVRRQFFGSLMRYKHIL